jgi:phosphate-selective porin OprO/OprP
VNLRLRLASVAAVLALGATVTRPALGDDLVSATPTPGVEAPVSIEEELDEHRARPEGVEAQPEEATPHEPFEFRLYWKRGLNYVALRHVRLERESGSVFDGALGLNGRIGFKLGVDTAGYVERGSLPEPGVRFDVRRVFVYTTGEFRLLVPILFKFDLGGVGDSLYFSDFYFWLQDVPYVGTVKLGQFDAPMSLELLTGSTYETFMEYGSPVEAFAPGLKAGVQIADHTRNRRVTWALGFFTESQEVDVGDASDSVARLTGRVTWLALEPRGADDTLLHLGASASYVLSSGDRIRYSSRPESFLAPKLVDTGDLDTNDAFPFGFELAAKRGPLTIQAEYLASAVDAGSLGQAYFHGVYGSASWFLTGEQRLYDASLGKMGPLTPARDLDLREGRWGAWELAARASWLDLTDGQIRGGAMTIWTGGINWYWNRYVRILFDTSFARVDDAPNDGHMVILQSRFQLVF